MKKILSKLKTKRKAIIAAATTIIGTSGIAIAAALGIDTGTFQAEKGQLWSLIEKTPKNTSHMVIINGFVGTSIVTKYLDEVVKDQFTVGVIRGYMSSGKASNEKEIFNKYSNLEHYDAPKNSTHMKSYFWFNENKKIIRTLTGSGNFSESAIFKVPDFKEVLYDVTEYEGVGRDLFCGGVDVSRGSLTADNNRILQNSNTRIPKTMQELYLANCNGFTLNNSITYNSGTKIIAKQQLDYIIQAHQTQFQNAKGLIVLTGDGGTDTIKKYIETTSNANINLDVFVGNSSVGIKSTEKDLITKYKERLNIIREHPLSSSTKNKDPLIEELISNKVAKTHTKIYVWYDQNNNIIGMLSGSANFAKNGIDLENTNKPFREVLIKLKLDKDWKNQLVCKTIARFKTKPSLRINSFCGW